MNDSNIASLDRPSVYRVSEEPPDYDAEDTERTKQLHRAQELVGQALNLAGLLLAALEDQGDRRAMQVYVATQVIERKLEKAHNRLDKHEDRCAKLHVG